MNINNRSPSKCEETKMNMLIHSYENLLISGSDDKGKYTGYSETKQVDTSIENTCYPLIDISPPKSVSIKRYPNPTLKRIVHERGLVKLGNLQNTLKSFYTDNKKPTRQSNMYSFDDKNDTNKQINSNMEIKKNLNTEINKSPKQNLDLQHRFRHNNANSSSKDSISKVDKNIGVVMPEINFDAYKCFENPSISTNNKVYNQISIDENKREKKSENNIPKDVSPAKPVKSAGNIKPSNQALHLKGETNNTIIKNKQG